MSTELIHPEGLHRVDVHAQVSVTRGARTVRTAGQVAWDVEGNLVGADDVAAQTEQCFRNVFAALDAAGAGPDDLAHVTVYVVDLDPARGEQVMAGRARAAASRGVELQVPGTYVGVTSLFAPGFLVEVDAVAVRD